MRLSSVLRDVFDLCFAAQCAACDAPASGDFLCADCSSRLELLATAPACERCAMPLPMRDAPCPHCRGKGVSHFESIVALGRFEEPLKHLIHRMKYRRHWPIAEHLADQLRKKNRVVEEIGLADVIIPVPLHPFRQFRRGYNQSQLIAARFANSHVIGAVKRSRNTPSQTNLHSHEKRIENLRDAFCLTDIDSVAGRRVLIVDDVMTSGATLQSIARTLTPAKPKSLHAIVLAIADPNGRKFESV